MIARRQANIGSAQSAYHPVNSLSVSEVAMRNEGRNLFNHIIKNGNWVVKKLDFSAGELITLRCRVSGVGAGFLYVSYQNEDQPELIAISRVSAGFHDIKVRIPYSVLHNFKIGVASTVPQGHGIKHIDNSTKYQLQTNSMLIDQHKPMFETSGIGFGGLGAFNINQVPRGGSDSLSNPYWDGNFANYSWEHGFAGQKTEPTLRGEYHGYYAHRANLMIARFDESDNFLGWDALEGYGYDVPAGVPLCLVIQCFVLEKKTSSGKGDREKQDPWWDYANNMQLGNILFVDDSFFYPMTKERFNPPVSEARPHNPNKSVIGKYGPNRHPTHRGFQEKLSNGSTTYRPLSNAAMSVEWYNEATNTWTSPTKLHSGSSHVKPTNEMGFTKAIFRFPRQLDAVSDKDILAELSKQGVNYDISMTKKCYPYNIGGNGTNDPAEIGYQLIGRPMGDAAYIEEEPSGKYVVPSKLNAPHCEIYLQYGNHPRAGVAGEDKGGPKKYPDSQVSYIQSTVGQFGIQDAEKFARMNTPELFSVFYPAGGFKSGGIVAGIGRGLSKAWFAISARRDGNPSDGFPSYDKYYDGTQIGTKETSIVKMSAVILSTDLTDNRSAVGEAKLQALWKAKFGQELDASFFDDYAFPDQDPNDKLCYRIRDPETGLWIKAPFEIFYFDLTNEYEGPYYDYELVKENVTEADGTYEVTSLKIAKDSSKAYSFGESDFIYLVARTPFGYYRSQQFDIIKQVEEQRILLDLGLSPEEALKVDVTEYQTEDTSAIVQERRQIENSLLPEIVTPEEARLPVKQPTRRYTKYPWEALKKNPKYFKETPLSGFTNARNFYVEDVTDKWGNINGLGYGFDDYMYDFVEDGGEVVEDSVLALSNAAGSILELITGNPSGAASKATTAVKKAGASAVSMTDFATELPVNTLRITDDVVSTMTSTAYESAKEETESLISDLSEWTGFGSIRSNGLGETTAEKLERYGENTTSFVKGAAKGITPDAIQTTFNDTIGTIGEAYQKHPILYTTGLVVLGSAFIPGVGGVFLRNISNLVGAGIKMTPEVIHSVAKIPGALVGGSIDSATTIVNSVSKPNRGTAAARRRAMRKR